MIWFDIANELLPPAYQKVKDIYEYAKSLNDEFLEYVEYLNAVLNNFFVQTCDSSTLSDLERITGIDVYAEETIEERKAALLQHLSGREYCTEKLVRERLSSDFTDDNYELYFGDSYSGGFATNCYMFLDSTPIASENKLQVIKAYKAVFECSLVDAKNAVESYMENYDIGLGGSMGWTACCNAVSKWNNKSINTWLSVTGTASVHATGNTSDKYGYLKLLNTPIPSENKLKAYKAYKAVFDSSLIDAKTAVDTYVSDYNIGLGGLMKLNDVENYSSRWNNSAINQYVDVLGLSYIDSQMSDKPYDLHINVNTTDEDKFIKFVNWFKKICPAHLFRQIMRCEKATDTQIINVYTTRFSTLSSSLGEANCDVYLKLVRTPIPASLDDVAWAATSIVFEVDISEAEEMVNTYKENYNVGLGGVLTWGEMLKRTLRWNDPSINVYVQTLGQAYPERVSDEPVPPPVVVHYQYGIMSDSGDTDGKTVETGTVGHPEIKYTQTLVSAPVGEVGTMMGDIRKLPLTFKMQTSGNICFEKLGSLSSFTVEYRVNNGEWTSYTVTEPGNDIALNAGDKIEWRCPYGNHPTGKSYNDCVRFRTSADIKIYGNVASTRMDSDYDTPWTDDRLTPYTSFAFNRLFDGCSGAIDAEDLVIPMPTSEEESYAPYYNESYCADMFSGCSGLTKAPDLSNLKLTGMYSHAAMFMNCTSLVDPPPLLPGKQAGFNSYLAMFVGCTSLRKSPIIAIESISDSSSSSGMFNSMFSGCTSLNEVWVNTEFEAVPGNRTENWLLNVASSGVIHMRNTVNWPIDSPDGIPSGWTVIQSETTYTGTGTLGTYQSTTIDGATRYVWPSTISGFNTTQVTSFSQFPDEISAGGMACAKASSFADMPTTNGTYKYFAIRQGSDWIIYFGRGTALNNKTFSFDITVSNNEPLLLSDEPDPEVIINE